MLIHKHVVSSLPTVTPTMAEDLTDKHLHECASAYCSDRLTVTMYSSMLGLDRSAEIERLVGSLARLHAEIGYRRDKVRVVALAYGFLQGVES